jgi:hypothetical protein
MSASGREWVSAPVKLYGYGARHAHPSVEFVDCPVCGAAPGGLCTGADGEPYLGRHYLRAYAYWEWKLAHQRLLIPALTLTGLPAAHGVCGFRGCHKTASHVLVIGGGPKMQPQLRCCRSCGEFFRRC